MRAREIVKFFSGLAANRIPTHPAMAAIDTESTMLGIACMRELHTMTVVVWAIVLAPPVCLPGSGAVLDQPGGRSH
jgi:hypothetical protein